MQKKHPVLRIFLVVLSIIIVAPLNIFGAQAAPASPQGFGPEALSGPPPAPPQDRFSEAELDQMLAPVALYPDPLLGQMLMAATYPLEVVEAARWIRQNPNLKGDALDQALQNTDWDVSVQSLAHFPQVLEMMNEQIEWTTRVGDAFLAQRDAVMDTVQNLRARAESAGNLRSTREQNVVNDQGAIEIAPANPGVVYVPVYDPLWAYGPWWYPAYLPFAIGYAGLTVVSGVIDFAFGFPTAFFFGWCDWDWHHHDIYVDYDRIGHFHRFGHYRFHGWETWNHDPAHRRGVAYWDRATSQRFGQSPARSIQNRHEARGYSTQGVQGQHGVSGFGSTQGIQGQHGASSFGYGSARVQRQSPSAFSGVRDGRSDQRASYRGQLSRGGSTWGFLGGGGHGFLGSGGSHGGGSHGGKGFFGGGGRGK